MTMLMKAMNRTKKSALIILLMSVLVVMVQNLVTNLRVKLCTVGLHLFEKQGADNVCEYKFVFACAVQHMGEF